MKKSGVALLATIISIAVLLLVSGGFFTILASNTGLIKSGGESLQAQYFAQLEADTIKMLSYDEVDNITQDTWQEFDIDNSWQYKVNVGPEQNVGDSDNTMKIASISVRKNGDTINRFALDVPLSSQYNSHYFNENGWCKLPNGLIFQWGKIVYIGTHNFPIEFPNKCLTLVVGNADQQGGRVDNAFGYIIDNKNFYVATKRSDIDFGITSFPCSWIAIGY